VNLLMNYIWLSVICGVIVNANVSVQPHEPGIPLYLILESNLCSSVSLLFSDVIHNSHTNVEVCT
jgi:hypothetical protein